MKLLSFLLFTVILSPNSEAAVKDLNLNVSLEREIQGVSTINLDRIIENKYPNLKQSQIESLHIVTKSENGNAMAEVSVGSEKCSSSIIDGDPINYGSQSSSSYRTVELKELEFCHEAAPLNLQLQGPLKIKALQIKVKSKSDSPPDNGGFGGDKPPKIQD